MAKNLVLLLLAIMNGAGVLTASAAQTGDTTATHQARPAHPFQVRNPIDTILSAQWTERNVKPAPLCTDEEFVRRVYLDVCGVIPRIEELKRFVNDTNPYKRSKLIDKLLGPPRGALENTYTKPRSFDRQAIDEQYARHWAMIWCDMLAADTSFGGIPIGHCEFRQWIKDSLAENKAYDVFVREMLMSTGLGYHTAYSNPASHQNLELEFFNKEPTNSVASVFMGTRMACAQCHDHPFDKWTQQDFRSLQSFFSRRVRIFDPLSSLLRVEAAVELPPEAQKLLEPYFNEAREEVRTSNHPIDLISGNDNYDYAVTRIAPQPCIKSRMPQVKSNSQQTDLAAAIKAPAQATNAPAMNAPSMNGPAMSAPPQSSSDKAVANDLTEAPRFADIVKEFRSGNDTGKRVLGIVDWAVNKLATDYSYPKEKCDWLRKELSSYASGGPAFLCDKPEAGDPRLVISYFPWDPTKVFDPRKLPADVEYRPAGPRRAALAEFVISSRQFAEVQANRLWAQLIGRGIVDPIDQFMEKNPPSNPALLQYLTDEFIASSYDNKHLLRLILNSSAYQLAVVEPGDGGVADPALFAAPVHRRMTAEQVFDSLLIATGFTSGWDDQILNRDTLISQHEYDRWLPIHWAFDLPSPAPLSSALMQAYKQPLRHDPSFHRNDSASIAQKLELMNGLSNDLIKNSSAINRWVATEMSAEEMTREAFLTLLARQPSSEELKFLVGSANAKPDRKWAETLVWSLMNSSEFVYRR